MILQGQVLMDVSNALVKLHKEQFGRGPTHARAHFAGPDSLLCVLDDVLLPAERKLVGMGEGNRVRESRMAYQVATAQEFVEVVERILGRRVVAFASAVDPDADVVFECYVFAPEDGPVAHNGDGSPPSGS